MKKQLSAIAAFLFTFSVLQAQENTTSPSEFQRNFVAFSAEPSLATEMTRLAYNEDKYQKFKKMRTTGMVLTGVGAGLITTGIILISSGNSEKNNFGNNGGTIYVDDLTPGDRKIVGGVFCIIFGTLSTGGGITLWTIGNNKMKKYSALNLQSTKNGLGVAYSF